jgi:hypothetical protein
MEVEDEDSILKRLFFKRFGRALPEETEKEKESDVDQIKFVIDLTDDTDEMESDPTPVLIPVVKTELIEVANVAEVNVANVTDVTKRRSFRLERLEMAKARKAITEFGKSLRKADVIPEKEAPEDTDMAEDVSANPVGSVNSVNPEPGNTVNAVESVTTSMTYEQTMAAIDAAIADN